MLFYIEFNNEKFSGFFWENLDSAMTNFRVYHPKVPYDFFMTPERVGAEPGREEKIVVWKKLVSRLRVVHNPEIPLCFLTAPERVGAEPGREEKIVIWKK